MEKYDALRGCASLFFLSQRRNLDFNGMHVFQGLVSYRHGYEKIENFSLNKKELFIFRDAAACTQNAMNDAPFRFFSTKKENCIDGMSH